MLQRILKWIFVLFAFFVNAFISFGLFFAAAMANDAGSSQGALMQIAAFAFLIAYIVFVLFCLYKLIRTGKRTWFLCTLVLPVLLFVVLSSQSW